MANELPQEQIAALAQQQIMDEQLKKVREQYSVQIGEVIVGLLNLPFPITPPGREHTSQGMRVLRRILVSTAQSNGYTLNELVFHVKQQWLFETDSRRKAARERKKRRAEAKVIGLEKGIPIAVIEETLAHQFGPEQAPEDEAKDAKLEEADQALVESVAAEGKAIEAAVEGKQQPTLVDPSGAPLN